MIGEGGQRHAPVALPPGRETRYPLYRRFSLPKYRKKIKNRILLQAVPRDEAQNQRIFAVCFFAQAGKDRLCLNHRLHQAVLTVRSTSYYHT